jgi:predicted DNA-binding transcriptional regulator AlpA
MANHKQTTALQQPNSTYQRGPADASLTVRQLDKALRILRVKQLVERTGLSRATLYVLMSTDPTFPRKIKLTVRAVGWLESEVDGWIVSRAQACGVFA